MSVSCAFCDDPNCPPTGFLRSENTYKQLPPSAPRNPAMESVKLDGGQASTNNSEPAGSVEH